MAVTPDAVRASRGCRAIRQLDQAAGLAPPPSTSASIRGRIDADRGSVLDRDLGPGWDGGRRRSQSAWSPEPPLAPLARHRRVADGASWPASSETTSRHLRRHRGSPALAFARPAGRCRAAGSGPARNARTDRSGSWRRVRLLGHDLVDRGRPVGVARGRPRHRPFASCWRASRGTPRAPARPRTARAGRRMSRPPIAAPSVRWIATTCRGWPAGHRRARRVGRGIRSPRLAGARSAGPRPR